MACFPAILSGGALASKVSLATVQFHALDGQGSKGIGDDYGGSDGYGSRTLDGDYGGSHSYGSKGYDSFEHSDCFGLPSWMDGGARLQGA